MVCEADEQRHEGDLDDGDELKKGHGGCGHLQPQIRKEGSKLFLQYRKPKDEDEVCDFRVSLHRTLTCFRILKPFTEINDCPRRRKYIPP